MVQLGIPRRDPHFVTRGGVKASGKIDVFVRGSHIGLAIYASV
jgi:hypothetical protein